ncbi:hypothetical protein [Shewanella sp.]|uniref:hypothetical protein n=1 Tax=Shewanella sp. TaxID=50422 RepID=UPI004054717D
MGLPVTVYRWDDAGAPQLTKGIKPSEFIDVLKKCLVTGYGSKAGAGWSVAFEDAPNQQIVFRNSTSQASGSFVKFWARGTGDGVKEVINFQSAPFLSTINPEWSTTNAASWRCYLNGTGNAYGKNWIIFATAASFYIYTFGDSPYNKVQLSTYHYPSFFCGDIHSIVPNDATRFITAVGNSVNDASATNQPSWVENITYLSDKIKIFKIHQTDGSDFPKQMQIRLGLPTHNNTAIRDTPPAGLHMFLHPITIEQVSYSPTLSGSNYEDSMGVNTTKSMLHPAIRGILPGLMQASFTGFTDELLPVTRTMNGDTYYLLPTSHIGSSNLWISTGDWYV